MEIPRYVVEATGLIAGSLTTIAFLPQLLSVYRTKSAKDLSWGWLATFTLGVIFWLLYGIVLPAFPVILANAVTLLLLVMIIVLKIRYHH